MGSVYRRFARKAAGISTAGAKVLDVGTGTGRLVVELAKAHPDWQITGVDISESMLTIARQNVAWSGLPDIEFRQAPAAALPFPDGCFGLVTSNAALHLWTDPVKVFEEIARVTAPGGYCLVRDNLRLAGLSPFLGLVGMILGMNQAQRRLWLQAVRASYTPAEARTILRASALKDACVSVAPDLLYLDIEWRKPQQ